MHIGCFYPGDSVPAEIRNFFLSLGEKWMDVALYLGFTPDEVHDITETHGASVDMQVREGGNGCCW